MRRSSSALLNKLTVSKTKLWLQYKHLSYYLFFIPIFIMLACHSQNTTYKPHTRALKSSSSSSQASPFYYHHYACRILGTHRKKENDSHRSTKHTKEKKGKKVSDPAPPPVDAIKSHSFHTPSTNKRKHKKVYDALRLNDPSCTPIPLFFREE